MIPAHPSPTRKFPLLCSIRGGTTNNTFLCFFLFLCSGISLHSCGNRGKPEKSVQDTSFIKLPATVAVDEAQKQKFNNACQLWYDTVLKNSNFRGGIIVAKNGNVVFEKYKGDDLPKTGDSILPTTPLHIASVTKTFTAMGILKLWQEGRLNIDDTFDKHFPEFNYPGVTIKSLLNHRSGLPNYLYFMDYLGWDKSNFITNQDVLSYMIQRKSEIKNIGVADRSFSYCNTNYVLLALLIEKVTTLPYPEYMRKTFFQPLRMKNTYVFTLADTSRMTPSYDWRGRLIPINHLDQAYGDKNIYSTPQDLLIWDRALSSDVLFKPATLETAYTPYSNEKPGIKNYGLGWRMNIYPTGKKMIFHNGWWHGSNAVFIRLPEDDATIIVIGNHYTNAVYQARRLANIFSYYFADSAADSSAQP